jgi:hypothetical protein
MLEVVNLQCFSRTCHWRDGKIWRTQTSSRCAFWSYGACVQVALRPFPGRRTKDRFHHLVDSVIFAFESKWIWLSPVDKHFRTWRRQAASESIQHNKNWHTTWPRHRYRHRKCNVINWYYTFRNVSTVQ